MNLEEQVLAWAEAARRASRVLGRASSAQLNQALADIATTLESRAPEILAANALDLEQARREGLAPSMIERLRIKDSSLSDLVKGVREVQSLPNPLGERLRVWEQPNGLRFQKVRVPIGVIGIIFESRPNVTIDAAVLCLKTGNAVILRGGSEAFYSNQVLGAVLQEGLAAAGLPRECAQVVTTTDREAIALLCRRDDCIDLMIPRGGEGLIRTVAEHARMPVIKHYHGVCHVYVDEEADLSMAEQIIINAKCQRPGVCNALETLLVHERVAESFLPRLISRLVAEGVEVRGDARTRAWGGAPVLAATEEDWTTEYLDLILSIRVVENLTEAVEHLDRYGSKHSDAIVTRNPTTAERFFQEVDSATVYWNASTRFTDGGQFGFGAEIGISTDKLHARGPMGLEELTSYKYLIEGTGQIRT